MLIASNVTLLLKHSFASPVVSVGIYLFLDFGKEFFSFDRALFMTSSERAWSNLAELADGLLGIESIMWSDYIVPFVWLVSLVGVGFVLTLRSKLVRV